MADGARLTSGPARPGDVAARRLRAVLRRAVRLAPILIGRRPLEGFVDQGVAGEVRGWAFDPNAPQRRLRIVAVHEGKVVAEVFADQLRRDLKQDGKGDGRHGFLLALPRQVLEAAPCRVRIEAVAGLWRVQLVGGSILLKALPAPLKARRREDRLPAAPALEPARAAQTRATLLVWGQGGRPAFQRTAESWAAQDWPDTAIARLGAKTLGARTRAREGETFGPEDAEALRGVLRAANTVILAKTEDAVEPFAARLLIQGRPLADVVTWDVAGGAGRRPEARALGVLLGETLGGAFAVRGHVFDSCPASVLAALARGEPRALELWLAASTALRWAHAPTAVTRRAGPIGGWSPIGRDLAVDLSGYEWRPAKDGRPERLRPALAARRLSVGVWGGWSRAAAASLDALLGQATDMEVEILAPAASFAKVQAHVGAGTDARRVVRPVDVPGASEGSGGGAWLRAFSEAASGDAVLLCRAGVSPDPAPEALADIAAWALSPLAGTVTIRLGGGRGAALAGLGLTNSRERFSAGSAFDASRAGQARPVLGAPAAFLAVARGKLAAVGGIDAERFPDGGADMDLALRLRRIGCAGVLLGDLGARGGAVLTGAQPAERAAIGAFDARELAEAAYAWPTLEPRVSAKPRRRAGPKA